MFSATSIYLGELAAHPQRIPGWLSDQQTSPLAQLLDRSQRSIQPLTDWRLVVFLSLIDMHKPGNFAFGYPGTDGDIIKILIGRPPSRLEGIS